MNFISSKGNNKERVMHSKTDNIEIMNNDITDEVTEELFKSLLKRYQNNLEKFNETPWFQFWLYTFIISWISWNKSELCWIIYRLSWLNKKQKTKTNPANKNADLEFLTEKIAAHKNNPEHLSAIKVGEDIPSDFSMSTVLSFKIIENKHHVCRGKDCMKNFCESLREHAL